MAFKYLTGGVGGDLNNPEDMGGMLDDVVLVADGGDYFDIRTYEGNDLINASRSIASGQHIVFSGAGNDNFIGGSKFDMFVDGSGNDIGDLGTGGDVYYASAGNDRISGGAGNDRVNFYWLFSDDPAVEPTSNFNGIVFDLAKTTAQDLGVFGKDILSGFEDIDGSLGNDRFYGTVGADYIDGLDGNDVLDGRGGDDELVGAAGKDLITGGRGVDHIDLSDRNWQETNASARDIVIYKSIADSGIADGMYDTIRRFDSGTTATDDRISLKAIDANASKLGDQAFIFRGNGGFSSSAGEVRLEVIGTDVKVHVDTDADAADEMVIFVYNAVLTAADFIL